MMARAKCTAYDFHSDEAPNVLVLKSCLSFYEDAAPFPFCPPPSPSTPRTAAAAAARRAMEDILEFDARYAPQRILLAALASLDASGSPLPRSSSPKASIAEIINLGTPNASAERKDYHTSLCSATSMTAQGCSAPTDGVDDKAKDIAREDDGKLVVEVSPHLSHKISGIVTGAVDSVVKASAEEKVFTTREGNAITKAHATLEDAAVADDEASLLLCQDCAIVHHASEHRQAAAESTVCLVNDLALVTSKDLSTQDAAMSHSEGINVDGVDSIHDDPSVEPAANDELQVSVSLAPLLAPKEVQKSTRAEPQPWPAPAQPISWPRPPCIASSAVESTQQAHGPWATARSEEPIARSGSPQRTSRYNGPSGEPAWSSEQRSLSLLGSPLVVQGTPKNTRRHPEAGSPVSPLSLED
mmetsp:Transcript_62509/g.158261  ORF Transcript_62509/g.158261 Transcript_62509/m.158261 type:complete len:414 (+) Transcript_62509:254-1495(+)